MTDNSEFTPQEIVDFWFPDGPDPDPERHMNLWIWRMRGGANDEIIANYTTLTEQAAEGRYDDWAETPLGRLALIIVLDQFPRSVWAETAKAYSQDPKALALCLEGLDNGHFDALENAWYKTTFKLPLEHCECPQHMANLDRAVAIAAQLVEEAPESLRPGYVFGAQQPVKHRAVIARFGRHPHRNAILGRESTPQELEYLARGEFPHETDMTAILR